MVFYSIDRNSHLGGNFFVFHVVIPAHDESLSALFGQVVDSRGYGVFEFGLENFFERVFLFDKLERLNFGIVLQRVDRNLFGDILLLQVVDGPVFYATYEV